MTWEYWCAGVSDIAQMGKFMHAMLSGMAIMVVPSFAVCCGITLMAWRRRNSFVER